MALCADRSRASADLRQLAAGQLPQSERKTGELRAMRSTIARLVERCHGDDRPGCPILDDLAGGDRNGEADA